MGRIGALRNTLCLLCGDRRQSNSVAHRKVSTLLALQCVDVAQNPRELIEGEEFRIQPARQVYCESLLRLAHAASQDQNIARLVSSQMIHALDALVTMTPALGSSTDFERCVQVLKQVSLSPSPAIPGSFAPATSLGNSHLRLLAKFLGFAGQAVAETGPVSKRRKLSSEPSQVSLLIDKIHQLLESDPKSNNLPFEGNFMYEFFTCPASSLLKSEGSHTPTSARRISARLLTVFHASAASKTGPLSLKMYSTNSPCLSVKPVPVSTVNPPGQRDSIRRQRGKRKRPLRSSLLMKGF